MNYDSGVPGVPTPDEDREVARQAYLKDIHEEVVRGLDKSYDLIYVDYRDQLTDDQVGYVVADNYESLWESFEGWESEARWHGYRYVVDNILDEIERDHDEEYTERFDRVVRLDYEDEWGDDLQDEIYERESGDWVRDLIRQTSDPLLRIRIPLDDQRELDYWPDAPKPKRFLRSLGLDTTPENVSAARSILSQSNGGNVYVLATLPLLDLWETGEDIEFTLHDPHVLVSNPYQGDGWEEQLRGTITVRRGDMRTDKDQYGYGWEDIAGTYASAYETRYTLPPLPVDKTVQVV